MLWCWLFISWSSASNRCAARGISCGKCPNSNWIQTLPASMLRAWEATWGGPWGMGSYGGGFDLSQLLGVLPGSMLLSTCSRLWLADGHDVAVGDVAAQACAQRDHYHHGGGTGMAVLLCLGMGESRHAKAMWIPTREALMIDDDCGYRCTRTKIILGSCL